MLKSIQFFSMRSIRSFALYAVCLSIALCSYLSAQNASNSPASIETFPVILEPVEHTLITPMVTTRVVELPS